MGSADLFSTHFLNLSTNDSIQNSTPTPFNVSTTHEDLSHGERSEFEKHVSIIVPLIFGVICVVGVIGNSLVITVVLVDKQMRSTTNILILSLAVADLLFVIFCVPFTAVSYALPVWPFGDVFCKINQYMIYTCAYASVYTLVLMAVDRYLAVVHPLRSITLRTVRNAWIAVVVVWMVVLVGNTPLYLYYGEIKYEYSDQNRSSCTFLTNDNSRIFAKAFFSCFLFIGFVFPLGTTIVMYGLMVKKLLFGAVPGDGGGSAESLRVRKRVSVLVITVTVVFDICWMPIQIILFWSWVGTYPSTRAAISVQMAANCLAYMNSCVNPILYAFMSQSFYQSFRKLLCCSQSSREMDRSCRGGAGSRSQNYNMSKLTRSTLDEKTA